jgi:AraC-like DNA-binding protein
MLLPSVFAHAVGAAAPWPAAIATWGPGGASATHAHHAWHLVLALEGALRIVGSPVREHDKANDGGESRRARGDVQVRETSTAGGVVTRPDVPHAIDATGLPTVILFVDPESEVGAGFATRFPDPITPLDQDACASARGALAIAGASDDAPAAIARTLEALAVTPGRAPRHPRVRMLLAHLRGADAEADLSLEALARHVGLSPSRLLHIFSADVGIPLRPYLRWLRLERAGAAIAGGASLAEAAHRAGFADAAHMTRTFREMFGTTPSEVRRRQS